MYEQIIATQNLCCKIGSRYLLKDITWQVRRGQHWVVFGMNGCGKTTLLSIIAGYKPYSSGQLTVFGKHYTADNILAIRRRIGWVSSSFFDRYFTRESPLNIVLSGKFGTFGLDFSITNRDIKRAKTLLKAVGLAQHIDQPFQMMSKGERQNVLIARAFFSQPEILVLDEPCSGLDVLARAKMLNTVRELAHQTNATIIYVTHYTEEILTDVFTHTLLLKNGSPFAQGSTADLFTSENLSALLDCPVTTQLQQGHLTFSTNARLAIKAFTERSNADYDR